MSQGFYVSYFVKSHLFIQYFFIKQNLKKILYYYILRNMANWYNQVFEKAPEKGAPPRMYELPHVFDPENEDEEIEELLKTNKLDYVFSNNYNFRQLPTDNEQRKNFLNNAKPREQNPAGIPTTTHHAAYQKVHAAEQGATSAIYLAKDWLFGENSWINPMTYLKPQQAVRGGNSQKKKQRYNQRKTQRKNYSV
jgi:hypothetical protein